MKVTKDKVVSMHYTLKNDAGDVIDSSEGKETMDFLQGHGNIIPGLETALEGSKKGDKVEVSIEPEQGYGLKMDDAIQEIPGTALQGIEEVTVGMQLQSQDQEGNPFVVTVISIDSAPSPIVTEPSNSNSSVSTSTATKTEVSTSGSETKVSTTSVTDTSVITNVKVLDDKIITVDANHPLAGETLHFSVSIEDVRDALEEEVSHGHAHSAGGHSH